jgi:demethylmenaquinone methyltransferase/2-methoxy-6-polyprenyl-1,4-benzoquinol methylase
LRAVDLLAWKHKPPEVRVSSEAPADSAPGELDVLRVFESKSQIASYYDRISGVYDILAERPEREVRERGVESLAARPGECILEIGIGTGVSLVTFANAVGADGVVLGLDLSPRMIDRARERIEEQGLGGRVQLVRGDGATLPLASGVVDGIFISFTLELFDTPEIPVVLRECRRALRAGGRITVVALSKEEPSDFGTRALEWMHRHFSRLLDCRPIYARRSLEEAGFHVEKSEVERAWVLVEIVLAVEPGAEE